MIEHRIQFVFKGHIAKVNMPDIAYSSQHIDIEIPHGSRYHVIIPNTVKITFSLEITSTDKAPSAVKKVGRALVKQRCCCLVQKKLTRLITQTFMTRTTIFT